MFIAQIDSEIIWEMKNGHPKLSCLNQLKKLSTAFPGEYV
jgi:hypothetical protein